MQGLLDVPAGTDVVRLRHQEGHLAGGVAYRRQKEIEVAEAAVGGRISGLEAIVSSRRHPADGLAQPLLLLGVVRPPRRLPERLADHLLALRAGLLQRRAVDVDQGAVRLQQADQAAGGVDDGPVALLALQHDVLRAAAAGRLALQRLAERPGGKLLLALGDHQQDHADRQVDDRPEDVGARVGGGCGQLGKDEDIAAIEGEEKAAQAVADPGVLAPAQEQRRPTMKKTAPPIR